MSSQIYYIIDDSSKAVKFAGIALVDQYPLFYGGTSTGFYGSCEVQFEGTSISFVGVAVGRNLSVTIDDVGPAPATTIQSSLEMSAWYQSPLLDEGSHTMNITTNNLTVTSIDYLVVLPGKTTSLVGKTLAVDDAYPAIQYGSNWETTPVTSNEEFEETFLSTLHHTSTPGSKFTFTYSGSNMTIFGVFLRDQPGSFDLTTTIDDGHSSTQTFTGDPNSEPHWQPHFPLFTTGDLHVGQHTVTVELSKCVNQTLVVDYILYTPSFSSLAEMPAITTKSKPNNVAIIVGAIGGAVVLLGMVLLIWRWRYPKGKRRGSELPSYMDSMALKPFPGKPRLSQDSAQSMNSPTVHPDQKL
ncbi:hypothetical protein C8J56DRAFT_275794 [Mycena floridula]|nr:hypothetical protein C8J56DRAFT_275794 [Mycena floridula]